MYLSSWKHQTDTNLSSGWAHTLSREMVTAVYYRALRSSAHCSGFNSSSPMVGSLSSQPFPPLIFLGSVSLPVFWARIILKGHRYQQHVSVNTCQRNTCYLVLIWALWLYRTKHTMELMTTPNKTCWTVKTSKPACYGNWNKGLLKLLVKRTKQTFTRSF